MTVCFFILTLETKKPKRPIFQDIQKSNLHTVVSGRGKIAPHKSIELLELCMSIFFKDNMRMQLLTLRFFDI